MINILIDPMTLKMTGIIDFDFASVGHPYREFLSSFSSLDSSTPEGSLWEKEMEEKGVIRSGTIKGAETLKLLDKLEGLLAPY